MGWGKLEELSNGGEMFIHHEDARRGQPDWKPREFDAETAAALENMVGSGLSKFALRKSTGRRRRPAAVGPDRSP